MLRDFVTCLDDVIDIVARDYLNKGLLIFQISAIAISTTILSNYFTYLCLYFSCGYKTTGHLLTYPELSLWLLAKAMTLQRTCYLDIP